MQDTPPEAAIVVTPYLEQFAELASPVPDLAATLTTQAEQDANDDNVSFLRTPSSVSRSSPARAANSLPLLNSASRAIYTAGAESARRALEAAERRRRGTPTELPELGESNSPPNTSQTTDYPPYHEWEDEALDYDQADSDVMRLVRSAALHHERPLDTVPEVRNGFSINSRILQPSHSTSPGTPNSVGQELFGQPYMHEITSRSPRSLPRNSQSSRSRNRIQSYSAMRDADRLSQITADGEHSRNRIQTDIPNRELDRSSQSTGDDDNSSSTRVTRANSTTSLSRQSLQSQQHRQRHLQEARSHYLAFHQQQQQQHLLHQLQQQRQQSSDHNHHHQLMQNQHQHEHRHQQHYDYDQQRSRERLFWAQVRSGHQQSRATRPSTETQRQRYFENSANPPSSTRSLDDAIKYLERLRFCESIQESLSSAKAGGFEQDEFSAGTDFILDTTDIEPPAESSWLKIGGVLSGSQHAAVGTNLPSNSSNYRRLPNVSNLLHHAFSNSAASVPSGHVTFDQGSRTSRINTPVHINSEGDEKWPVKVTIHSIDYDSMTLAGTMEAFNVPDKSSPTRESSITTFLEGEIIDFNLHTLETKSFNANARVDGTYWRKLEPFKKLTDDEIVRALLSKRWLTEELSQKWLLMRWKGI